MSPIELPSNKQYLVDSYANEGRIPLVKVILVLGVMTLSLSVTEEFQ